MTITSGFRLGTFEVLRTLRHKLRTQNQRRHTIDQLEERGVERKNDPRSSLKGRGGLGVGGGESTLQASLSGTFLQRKAVVNQCLEFEGHRHSDEHWNCFKGKVWETTKRHGGTHMRFSKRIDIILNSTELTLLESAFRKGLADFRDRLHSIQIHNRFKRTLFIRTKQNKTCTFSG